MLVDLKASLNEGFSSLMLSFRGSDVMRDSSLIHIS